MTDAVEAILALWQGLPEDDREARDAFSRVYAEHVTVNGVELTLDELVARARALQQAVTGLTPELLERVEAGDKLVVAFLMHGRHTGTLRTSIGEVPATGRDVTLRGMDVLTFTDGRITRITVLADELGLLSSLDAVTLR
ncbi:MAG TPA: ester cyclase [Nocardioidaceae bacterium]|nr:ester cyclase [Nocardioidaceae bacterium]